MYRIIGIKVRYWLLSIFLYFVEMLKIFNDALLKDFFMLRTIFMRVFKLPKTLVSVIHSNFPDGIIFI